MGLVKLTLAFALLASGAFAQTWHKTLEDGKKAAAKSGRPVLLVTLWPAGT